MNAVTKIINAAQRSLDSMFPGYGFAQSDNTKHDHKVDFGFPSVVTPENLLYMYRRNGFAKGIINKTVEKTWETNPSLVEDDDPKVSTELEVETETRFKRIRFWQAISEADRRSLVGGYSFIVLRIADGQKFEQPVTVTNGGLELLAGLMPLWRTQLKVIDWDTDETSDTYGQPKMYQYEEFTVGEMTTNRSIKIHPSRVVIWSEDGTMNPRSVLEAGYNDLITVEKVIGAGGEGFWKNASARLQLSVDKEAKLVDMAKAMGVTLDDLHETMDKQVTDFQKGFDSMLMLQGMEAKPVSVSLPQPGEFVNVALQSLAASVSMPIKIMVGMLTGERASTEDAKEWAKTITARRNSEITPNLTTLIELLVSYGIMANVNWSVEWDDLTESDMDVKIARAEKMATINKTQVDSGDPEPVFTSAELREVLGYDPMEIPSFEPEQEITP